MKDLTTQEGRNKAIEDIEDSFIMNLRKNSFEICPDAVCVINRNSILLGITSIGYYKSKGHKMAFASEIDLYIAEPATIFGNKEHSINFGSSGSFNPEIKESYWRTIHAASILKKWGIAFKIAKAHCKLYSDLEKEIFNQLNPKKNEIR